MNLLDALVIGASGQVGGFLVHYLQTLGQNVRGTYATKAQHEFTKLDIRDTTALHNTLISLRPRVVYLPASLTNVEYCEENPDVSYAINVLGVKNLAQICQDLGIMLVYFSSDYIFDGVNGPYDESAIPSPINVYGRHKLEAENFVQAETDKFLILRTTVVYGPETQEKNFVYRLIRTLQHGEVMTVPDDQIGSPTYGPELAQVAVELVTKGLQGAFNTVGLSRASRYQFALDAAQIFNLPTDKILPIATEKLNQKAKRPLNAGLLTDKLQSHLGRAMMPYAEGLKEFQKVIEHDLDK